MSDFSFAVVEGGQADLDPYPYIYVEEDGSFREISTNEKRYLQEKFHPADGARPYVKSHYWQATPDAKLSGFLHRDELPLDLKEGEVPKRKK